MAALRFRGGSLFSRGARNSFSLLPSRLNPKHDPSSLLLPSLLVSSRGIAHKLFVGGISFYTTEDTLSEAFSQFGQVIEAKLVMDQATNKPKGFGFVKFASEEEAQKAIAEMNGKVLNGRVIYVEKAISKTKPTFHKGTWPIARAPRSLGRLINILNWHNSIDVFIKDNILLLKVNDLRILEVKRYRLL